MVEACILALKKHYSYCTKKDIRYDNIEQYCGPRLSGCVTHTIGLVITAAPPKRINNINNKERKRLTKGNDFDIFWLKFFHNT
jgi:hypothetical protein